MPIDLIAPPNGAQPDSALPPDDGAPPAAASHPVDPDAVALPPPPVDPLAGLLERVRERAGAALEPNVIAALAAMRDEFPASYETLRYQLKRAGVRVLRLDEEVDAARGVDAAGRRSQADVLLDALADADLYCAGGDATYADVRDCGHRETWPIRSTGFRRLARRRYLVATERAPNAEALEAALNTLDARAAAGPTREVHVRCAAVGDAIYFDLADTEWRAVEVTAASWRVVHEPPVRFRRAPGMLPLPLPERGGSVDELRALLNLRDDDDWVLALAWLLSALRGRGPYPILVWGGEQGTGKSTASEFLRALVDPNKVPLRRPPRDDNDVYISAVNAHVLAFDNLSGVSGDLSDSLCRLALGGGIAKRTLYSDADETLLDATRPIMLNGIDAAPTRGDLRSRCLFVDLESISDEKRRPLDDLRAAYDAARPRILGALLDVVAGALRALPDVNRAGLSRMADFCVWARACEAAGAWPPGAFDAAVRCSRSAPARARRDSLTTWRRKRHLVDERADRQAQRRSQSQRRE